MKLPILHIVCYLSVHKIHGRVFTKSRLHVLYFGLLSSTVMLFKRRSVVNFLPMTTAFVSVQKKNYWLHRVNVVAVVCFFLKCSSLCIVLQSRSRRIRTCVEDRAGRYFSIILRTFFVSLSALLSLASTGAESSSDSARFTQGTRSPVSGRHRSAVVGKSCRSVAGAS